MSGVSEGGVILPREGAGIPVDPNDPTKGTIIPVLDNRTLTGAVLELQQVVGQVGTVQQITGGAMYQAISELGALVEHLSTLMILALSELPITEGMVNEQQDEALETIKEFLRQRAEAREAEAAEQEAVDPAFAGPEATPPVPPPAEELDDSEAAADDATWD
jgi:hypothetical protein